MNDIFISYSRKDIEFVRQLSQAFKDRDYNVWVDLEGLYAGEEYWPQIRAAIEEASTFLFIISPDSAQSKFCRQEIDHAVQYKKRIVPVLYREVSTEAVPPEIAARQWQLFRDITDFGQGIESLVQAVASNPEWVRAHTRWLNRAIAWDITGRRKGALLRDPDLHDAEQWLSQASEDKEPQPTTLHFQYVRASRAAATQGKLVVRSVTIGMLVLLLVASALGVFVWEQNEEQEQQQQVSLVRRLTTQAELVRNWRTDLLERSLLLAVEATKLSSPAFSFLPQVFSSPSQLEAIQSLRQGLALLPAPATLGHENGISALAFSPNGQYLATASYDGIAYLWDSATRKQRARFSHFTHTHKKNVGLKTLAFNHEGNYLMTVGYDGSACVWRLPLDSPSSHVLPASPYCLDENLKVNAVAFSATGDYVATTSYDGTIRLWRTTGQQVRWFQSPHQPEKPSAGFTAVAFSPNGRYLAASAYDGSASIWHVSTGELMTRFWPSNDQSKPSGGLSAITFSPDEQYIATASYNGDVCLWNRSTSKTANCVSQPQGVTTLAFAPDSRRLATVSYDPIVRVWEPLTGYEVARFYHESGATAVAFTPSGNTTLATGSYDPFARLWQVTEHNEATHLFHEAEVSLVAFSPNGHYLATAGASPTVHLWETTSSHIIAHIRHSQRVTALSFSADGQWLATASDDKTACVWEVSQGRMVACSSHTQGVSALSFQPNSQFLATGTYDGTACLWNVPTGQQVQCFLQSSGVKGLMFSADGKYLGILGFDGSSHLWDATNGDEHPFPLTNISVLLFAPQGYDLATAGYDGKICLWTILTNSAPRCFSHKTGTLVTTLDLAEPPVTNLAFSPDGQYLATAGWDNTARLWRLSRCATVLCSATDPLRHDSGVTALTFSANGRYLATASYDHTVRVWEVPTGREIANFLHSKEVMAATFSPDSKLLATGSRQYAAQVGYFLAEDLRTEACHRLTRNLTHDEWHQYFGQQKPEKTCPQLPEPQQVAVITK